MDRKIRHADQKSQFKIDSIGLPGQDSSAGLPRQDFKDMTSVTEQPEQILL